jgi:transglutaminase-like putative cysteine protease
MPYATNAAYSAEGILIAGRGSCLAKADLLVTGFRELGYSARRVRWLYQLPRQPSEIRLLGTKTDVHSATEVEIDGQWVLVDATHDPPLAQAGLAVAEWDGRHSTQPAYEPVRPQWVEGRDDIDIDAAIRAVTASVSDEHAIQYQRAFNAWLDSFRDHSRRR